jgi:hypothetical protein
MQRSLDTSAMSGTVYIAIAFVLWAVTTSAFSLGSAAVTVWTWLLIGGGVALCSLAAIRIAVANELGVHSRATASDDAEDAASSLARRLGRLDTSLLVVIILWMLPLIAAMIAGITRH